VSLSPLWVPQQRGRRDAFVVCPNLRINPFLVCSLVAPCVLRVHIVLEHTYLVLAKFGLNLSCVEVSSQALLRSPRTSLQEPLESFRDKFT